MTKEELRAGNDALRRCLSPEETGRPDDGVFLTNGVASSPHLKEILNAVIAFDAFDEKNDPHGEHDYGRFSVRDREYAFKFDYYDENLKFGADPLKEHFRRVMTILRAEEY